MMIKKYFKAVAKDLCIANKVFKLVKSFAPHYFLHSILFSLEESLQFYIGIYAGALIIDTIIVGSDLLTVGIIALSTAAAEFILTMVSKYSWRMLRIDEKLIIEREEIYLNSKSFSIDYKHLEDPIIKEKRQKLHNKTSNDSIQTFVMSVSIWINALFDFIFAFFILIDLFSRLPSADNVTNTGFSLEFAVLTGFAIIIIYTVIFLNELRLVRRFTESEKNKRNIKEIYHYYLREYIGKSSTGKDMHIFNQKGLISNLMQKVLKEKNHYYYKNKYFRNYIEPSSVTLHILLGLGYFIVMFNAVGFGSIMKVPACFQKIVYNARTAAISVFRFHSSLQHLEKLLEYAEITDDLSRGRLPTEKRMDNSYCIEFHNVSFKYPGTDEYVIKNLDLKFEPGDRTALVGKNGGGKTTIVKLICRLYDPTEGYISLNGIDIRKFSYDEYLDLFSVVFQDFSIFSLSVGENVGADVSYSNKNVWSALEKAGIAERVKEMPRGLETVLNKDFKSDGVEISKGEAQKIAIARAIYKDAPFMILDEPTSSLDPKAEREIYSHFNNLMWQKNIIFVSHRLSACRFCDRVLVVEDGQIVEDGTHKELLKNHEGKYSELWYAQAEYYNQGSTQSYEMEV